VATKYFALLTNIGAAKLANATALGAKVEITQMAVVMVTARCRHRTRHKPR
jgi:phage-related tail fiber protein